MLTYLIEDSEIKTRRIRELLSRKFAELLEVVVFSSYQSALRAVKDQAPAIMILDMTLPNFDRGPNRREGKQRPLGGYEVMRKMRLSGISALTVVVTQLESFGDGDEAVSFKDITKTLCVEFPDHFMGSVYYEQVDLKWQVKLEELLVRAIERIQTDESADR
jgi:CheY-like chemotaxis protein